MVSPSYRWEEHLPGIIKLIVAKCQNHNTFILKTRLVLKLGSVSFYNTGEPMSRDKRWAQ